ncbi:MAG: LysM peptidoglycan-binding domain-containing protein [Planctomycetota bacterium]
MSDPFASPDKSQFVREAQIGLTMVALAFGLFVYVAYYKIMGHGYEVPDHVRDAPVAKRVWPNNPSNKAVIENQANRSVVAAPPNDETESRVLDIASGFSLRNESSDRSTLNPSSVFNQPKDRTSNNRSASDNQVGSQQKNGTQRPDIVTLFENMKLPSSDKSVTRTSRSGFEKNLNNPTMIADAAVQKASASNPISSGQNKKKKRPDDPFGITKPNYSNLLSEKKNSALKPKSEFSRTDAVDSDHNQSFVPTPKSASLFTQKDPLKKNTLRPNTSNQFSPVRNSSSNSMNSSDRGFNPILDSSFQFDLDKPIQSLDRPVEDQSKMSTAADEVTFVSAHPIGRQPSRLQDEGTSKSQGFVTSTELLSKKSKRSKIGKTVTRVVAANDTFWSIAQQEYGDGRYFRALYQFNRPTIVNYEDLEMGTTIGIPEVQTLVQLWPDLCPASENAESTEKDRRIYIVKPGESLFGIARDQLGQASRYVEIIQLNPGVIERHQKPGSMLPNDQQIMIPWR